MNLDFLTYIPVALVGLTAAYLLVSQNWRTSILALVIQYLAVFWLASTLLPLGLAAVKLVAGWMAGAMLSASQPEDGWAEGQTGVPSGGIFRLILAGLVAALVISISPALEARFPAPRAALDGGMLLVGLGLMQLGLSARPLRVVVGLLTVLAGFELFYAAVENSVMVVGLQAVVTLGLAMVGVYLLAAPGMGRRE